MAKRETKENEIQTNVVEEKPKEERRSKFWLFKGKQIVTFEYEGVIYQFVPNRVYTNLPDCEQVKQLMKENLFEEV